VGGEVVQHSGAPDVGFLTAMQHQRVQAQKQWGAQRHQETLAGKDARSVAVLSEPTENSSLEHGTISRAARMLESGSIADFSNGDLAQQAA
jgi:hypothetical protein